LDDALEVLPAVRWEAPRHARALVSPERRTQQTAEALGLEAVVAPELRECDFGAWAGRWLEGLAVEELMQWLGDVDAAPHGGESFGGLMRRVGAWLDGVRDGGGVGVAGVGE
jgi:broad specificity phosphatase PhoE